MLNNFRNITPTSMEKKQHKSGSLKRKERQKAEMQDSAKCCRSITDFYNTTTTFHINVQLCNK
jgi:hypothetical protein